jgi:hypothetical protein
VLGFSDLNQALALAATSAHRRPDAITIAILVLVLAAYIAMRRGWRPRVSRLSGSGQRLRRGLAEAPIRPRALVPTAVIVVLIVLLLVVRP